MDPAFATLPSGRTLEHRLEINRSVFLTRLERVSDEVGARAVIAAQRHAHPTARHHCSAFVLGADRQVRRSSDDGEPSGTAGVPMMQALSQFSLPPLDEQSARVFASDLVAVVTRWFGGVKLGAGGLVRAYSRSVSEALTGVPWVVRRPRQLLLLPLDVATAGRDESAIRAAGIGVVDVAFGPSLVELVIATDPDPDSIAQLGVRCEALVGRTVSLEPLGLEWVDEALH